MTPALSQTQQTRAPRTAAPDFARDLARAQRIARLLDARFQVAGVTFGWDSIIGLVPVAGDVVTAVFALYPIHLAQRHKLGGLLIARMLANVAVDVIVGAVPVLGDIFDIVWKANYRNLRLLHRASDKRSAL